MKNIGINFYALIFCLFTWVASFAQTSTNVVRFQVTYDASTTRYTVWVVPEYSTPNSNNTGTTEKGATAQVTLAVPSSFTITSIVDMNGGWEKTPLKLGPGQPNQNWSNSGLPTDTNYYIIGKSATETDYGTFTSGTAVPLFTFQGVSCVGPVRVIAPNDPFINAADQTLSLNAGNSFYSRSAQPAGGNQNPLEQFIGTLGTSASCGVQSQIVMTPITTTISTGTNPTTIPVLPSITVGGQPATSSNVSITIPQQPSFGSVVVNPDGTIRFTPSPTFSGTGTFDVRVCSVSNPTNCVTSTITVQSPIVMTPITTPIVSGTNPTTIPVLPSITVGGQPATSSNVSITIPQQPSFGSVVVNPDGTIRFTPSPTFSGTGTFDVRVCSVSNPTNCVTSTITVQSPIVMTPITTPIVSGTNPTTIPALPSITVGGQPATSSNVSITIPQQPSFGSVVVNPDGTIRFTPSPTFSGTGTFDVRVCSVSNPTNCVTSTITVQSPIVMTPITTPIVSGTNPTTIPVLPSITVGGQPATSSNVSITIPQQPSFGSVVVNPDGTIRFTPSPTFSGTGTFDVRVCSVSNPTNCVTSTITVQSPIVMTPITTPIVSGTNPTTIPVLPSITVGGQPATSSNVSITIPQQPSFGSVVVNPDGTIRFTPSPTFSGTGTFDVRVCSVSNPTNCVTSTITVQSPIVMTPITTPIVSGTNPTTIPVLPSITVGGQPATSSNVSITIPQQPSFGSVVVNPDGTIRFTPSPTFSGTGTFDVRVCSVSNPTNCVTSTITVQSPIVMTPITTPIVSGTNPTTIPVLPSITVGGQPATSSNVSITIPQQPSFGSVVVNPDGTIRFTPSPTFSGTGTFDVRVCSITVPTNCATSTITVVAPAISSNLVLTQTVSKSRASVNDQVVYRLVVRNEGPSTATNIQIRNTTSAGQTSVSNVPNRGTFASNVWTIPSIASGDSAVLLITNRIIIEGVVTNEAEVVALDQTDPNILNNKISSCVSIPMFLCNGQNLQLSVPSTYTNVRWFRNGVMIGTGTSINISQAGSYTTLADNSTCPASGCCPIEVILEECCPPSICIPLTIKKL